MTFSAQIVPESSNIFNQPNLAAMESFPAARKRANFSVIAPIADRLSNSGTLASPINLAWTT